jgi:hypothetical protein
MSNYWRILDEGKKYFEAVGAFLNILTLFSKEYVIPVYDLDLVLAFKKINRKT